MGRAAYDPTDLYNAGYYISDFPFWDGPVLLDGAGLLSCPGYTGDTYAANVWDYVSIPGTTAGATPGICEVNVTKDRAFDEKKSAGGDGARVSVHGLKAGQVEIKITIWTPEQLKSLIELWSKLFPGQQKIVITKKETVAGPSRTEASVSGGVVRTVTIPTTKQVTTKINQFKTPVIAFDVSHPKLYAHNIGHVVFVGGSGPDPGPTKKTRVFTMKAIEYVNVKKINTTTTPTAAIGSINDPGGTIEPPGKNPENTGAHAPS